LFESNTNQISAFQVDSSTGLVKATLTPVTGPNTAGGMTLSASNFLYVSDFINNSVDAFSVNPSTGALTSVSGSPFMVGPNQGAEGMAVDPAGKFLFVTQPNTSQVAVFSINSTGQLKAVGLYPASSFPVQAVVNPSGNFLYVSNNQDPLGGISAYSIDSSTGVLTPVSGSPFPTLINGGPIGMAIHPNGKFLYIAMAGTTVDGNQIVVESIDAATGALSPVPGSPFPTGAVPQSVVFNPTGTFLFSANMKDNTVTQFSVDANTGALSPAGGNASTAGSGPFAMAINSTGAVLFVANGLATSIPVFTINSTTGALTGVAPIPSGGGATGLAIVHHP
jgi:6-phosphogluconolactonase (cycloisomerase 2 family)